MNPQTTYFADAPRTSEMFRMNNPVRFNTITPTKHHPSTITPTKHHLSNGKRLDNYAGNPTPWSTRTAPSETLAELVRAFTFLMHRTRYWKHPHFRLRRHSGMKPRVTKHGKDTLSPAYRTPCEHKYWHYGKLYAFGTTTLGSWPSPFAVQDSAHIATK